MQHDPNQSHPDATVEIDCDVFRLVLQLAVPELVIMSMRMANRSLNDLAEIIIDPHTGAVIDHAPVGHGRDFPPFRLGAWVEAVKPRLSQLTSGQPGTATRHFENPRTGDLDPPSD